MEAAKATKIHSKVAGGTIGAAVSVIAIWLVESTGVVMPGRVEDAAAVVFVAAFGWLASP